MTKNILFCQLGFFKRDEISSKKSNADVWTTVGCVRIGALQRRSNYCCATNLKPVSHALKCRKNNCLCRSRDCTRVQSVLQTLFATLCTYFPLRLLRKSMRLRTCPELPPAVSDNFEFSVFMRTLAHFRVLTIPWQPRHFKTHEIGFKWSDFKV